MKIVRSDYILGLIVQAIFIGGIVTYTNIWEFNIFRLAFLILFILLEIGIALLLRLRSISTFLGFITGGFACVVFVGMTVMELIIHPPSEE